MNQSVAGDCWLSHIPHSGTAASTVGLASRSRPNACSCIGLDVLVMAPAANADDDDARCDDDDDDDDHVMTAELSTAACAHTHHTVTGRTANNSTPVFIDISSTLL